MKLKVGVLGIGNAGGQVAALAKKEEDIAAIAINVSEDDNETLKGVVTTLGIGNAMGSGKNRDRAKTFGKAAIKNLISQDVFDGFIRSCQVVFVVYSTGGGTGSALGPMMTAVLKSHYASQDESERIRFINVGILPALTEALQAQENTIASLRELTSYDSCYTLYDNDRHADLPVNEMMEKVNKAVVEDIKVIRGDYNILSKYNQIDPQDMLNIISFDGMFRIVNAVGFQEKDLDKTSIEDILIDNLSTGATCEIDRDRIVKCIAPIVNIRASIANLFNPGLPKLRDIIGEPPVEFQHYYIIEDSEEFLNRVHVIISGLSTPDDRLKKVVQRIEEAKKLLSQSKKSAVLASIGETQNFVKDANTAKNASSIDDIMSNF